MRGFQHLETVIHVTPLGIECRDIATREVVRDGVWITATPRSGGGRTATAFAARSGVYAFEHLPGLHAFEYPAADGPAPEPGGGSPDLGRPFVIQVEDPRGWFLPWGVELSLPRRNPLRVYLFSAPSRPPPAGLALIRGVLADAGRPAVDGALPPAPHARVEARYEGTGAGGGFVGLADARGQFALPLPFPDPLRPPFGMSVTSPNTAGRQTLAELRWPVTLSFAYDPRAQRFFCLRPDGRIEVIVGPREGLTDRPPPGWRCVPDLPALLRQPAAVVHPPLSPSLPASTLQAEMAFGQETIVRTEGADGRIRLSPP